MKSKKIVSRRKGKKISRSTQSKNLPFIIIAIVLYIIDFIEIGIKIALNNS